MEARISGSPELARPSSGNRTSPQMDVSSATAALGERTSGDNVLTSLPAAAVDPAELEAALLEMNALVQASDRDIAFQLDDDSGQVVISVTDRASGDVIRQIPSEQALELAAHLSDMRSLMFKTEV